MNLFSTSTRNSTGLITLSIFKRVFQEVISFQVVCTIFKKLHHLPKFFSKYVAPSTLKIFDKYRLEQKIIGISCPSKAASHFHKSQNIFKKMCLLVTNALTIKNLSHFLHNRAPCCVQTFWQMRDQELVQVDKFNDEKSSLKINNKRIHGKKTLQKSFVVSF